jgi:hypothetical protein
MLSVFAIISWTSRADFPKTSSSNSILFLISECLSWNIRYAPRGENSIPIFPDGASCSISTIAGMSQIPMSVIWDSFDKLYTSLFLPDTPFRKGIVSFAIPFGTISFMSSTGTRPELSKTQIFPT